MKKLTTAFTLITLISGCATQQAPQTKQAELTYGMVTNKIKKGVTTKDEVVKMLGNPNIMTQNKEGEQVWTYSRQSYDSSSGSAYGTLLFVGGSKAVSSSSSKSFDLILTFDENDVVKDYTIVSSQF